MVIDVLKNVKNRFLMRSEQILTQQHLIEQRMQPVLLVYLGHGGHLAVLLLELVLRGVLRNAFVDFDSVACEGSLGRLVLLLGLREVLLRLASIHLKFSLFFLVIRNRLIIDREHIIVIDTIPIGTTVSRLQS